MLKKISQFFLSFLELQLFVSLISWPLLLAWGLPLSWATPAGNLLFNPLLAGFIFLSSLCLITELLHIPNGFFIWLLDQLTNFWLWCISWGSDSFLLYFPKPSTIVLLVIAFCAVSSIIVTSHRSLRIALLSIFFIFFGIMTHLVPDNQTFTQVLPFKGKNTVLLTHKTRSVLLIGEQLPAKNGDQWVQYTLKPALIKTTGKATLDLLIVCITPTPAFVNELQKNIAITTITYQAMSALPFYTTQLQVDQRD